MFGLGLQDAGGAFSAQAVSVDGPLAFLATSSHATKIPCCEFLDRIHAQLRLISACERGSKWQAALKCLQDSLEAYEKPVSDCLSLQSECKRAARGSGEPTPKPGRKKERDAPRVVACMQLSVLRDCRGRTCARCRG